MLTNAAWYRCIQGKARALCPQCCTKAVLTSLKTEVLLSEGFWQPADNLSLDYPLTTQNA